MTIVNLGNLRSDIPAATGLCQIKRGGGAGVAYSASVPQNTRLSDGAGPNMGIGINVGSQPGWWVVRAETIWLANDAAWYYFTWNITLSQPDADGVQQAWNHMCQHPNQGWMESCIDVIFRLQPDTYYQASMCWGYTQAGSQTCFTAGEYHYIFGEFVGEGAL